MNEQKMKRCRDLFDLFLILERPATQDPPGLGQLATGLPYAYILACCIRINDNLGQAPPGTARLPLNEHKRYRVDTLLAKKQYRCPQCR